MALTFTIREKRPEDGPVLACLLVEAFLNKYKALAGSRRDKALAIVKEEMDFRGVEGNFFVAETDGKIIGAIEILDTDISGVPREKEISIYLNHLGLARGLKSIYLLSLLARALGSDEACVSQLAVSSEARRLGVARALLAHGENYARRRQKKHLLLWVAESNTPAVSLYESAGFEVVRKTGSGLHKRFFGEEVWLEFDKNLTERI